MAQVEDLLKPVSADAPCGVDLSYDAGLAELQTAIKGKPETQFSAAEEPNWREVHEKATALFARSKDLRVAVILCLAQLKTEGLDGLAQGTEVIHAMVERFWPDLFPRLDPEEGNDPTERLNILGSLAAAPGTLGDPISFIDHLRRVPLTDSRIGRHSMADLTREEGAPDAAQVAAAFRDTDPALLQARHTAVVNARQHLNAVNAILENTLGEQHTADFSRLTALLQQIEKTLAQHLPEGARAAAGAEPADSATAAATPAASGDGEIRSRKDVVRALERICDYYAKHEPSSPLPFLLRRAQRLVEMNFLQAISELTPDALAQLQNIMGVKPEPPAS